MAGSVGAQSGMIINLKIVDQVMQSFFALHPPLALNAEMSFRAVLNSLNQFVEAKVINGSSHLSALEVQRDRTQHIYRAERSAENLEFSVVTQVNTYIKASDSGEWSLAHLVFRDFVNGTDKRLSQVTENAKTRIELSRLQGLLSILFLEVENRDVLVKKSKKYQVEAGV